MGGIAGVGLIGTAIVVDSRRPSSAPATSAPTTSKPATATQRYVSTDLTTSKMAGVQTGETAPGLLLVQPQANGFNGVIMDNRGEPVWMAPTDLNLTDLRVQEYQGKPVLTYWTGQSVSGHGDGSCTILDTSYQRVATVQAAPDMQADLHEFHLTPQGTALLTAYPTVAADLSSVGGPKDGYVLDCHICEIDIATGAVLFNWSSLAHIPVDETYASVRNSSDADGKTPPNAFDAYHMNSIDFDDENRLYISSRHTHTIYCIDRSNGDIIWRMGGKSSDFAIEQRAKFAWQHHVRKRANGAFSIFDNHSRSSKSSDKSRGILVNVDEQARTVTLQKAFSADLLSIAMGSMDLLDNGNWILGWGTQPVVTEHRPDGKVVLRVDGLGTGSYRAFRQAWVAAPLSVPDVAVRNSDNSDEVESSGTGSSGTGSSGAGSSGTGSKRTGSRGTGSMSDAGMIVYASWNGATEVRSWRILTGDAEGSLREASVVVRNGFETAAKVRRARYAAVEALDIGGNVLATSKVVRPT